VTIGAWTGRVRNPGPSRRTTAYRAGRGRRVSASSATGRQAIDAEPAPAAFMTQGYSSLAENDDSFAFDDSSWRAAPGLPAKDPAFAG
jgi:hypothetical protein